MTSIRLADEYRLELEHSAASARARILSALQVCEGYIGQLRSAVTNDFDQQNDETPLAIGLHLAREADMAAKSLLLLSRVNAQIAAHERAERAERGSW